MPDDGIRAFWDWWPQTSGKIDAAINGGRFDNALIAQIAERVHAIDLDLDWELSPGRTATHAFCLSSKGDPVLRRVAERWLRAAPSQDGTWEFHAARIGRDPATLRLKIGGFDLAFADVLVAFEINETRELIDVTCFHPSFREMEAGLRNTATFLMLDGAFGEDDVERWFGGIESTAAPPAAAGAAALMQAAVRELERTATGEKFGILELTDPEGRVSIATINMALKRINNLTCDHHVAVDLALLDPDPRGLTTGDEARELNILEDDLTATLGDVAAYFGRETGLGRRVMHFFASQDPSLKQRIEQWASRHRHRYPRITWREDPLWEARARFL